MRVNSKGNTQLATFDGTLAGEGLAIFLSQGPTDIGRWRFVVKAMNSQMTMQVGEVFSSPPNATNPDGGLSRMIAGAVCPGVESWAVEVSCAPMFQVGLNNQPDTISVPPDETADVVLLSSKCCTGPIGLTRVSERYLYQAGSALNGTATLHILPGRTIKSWSAIASGVGDGSAQLTAVNDANVVVVPNGTTATGEPGIQILNPAATLVFTNVNYIVEYLESA